MVELAIVLPLILLLVFGIIEYGFAFNADSNVNQAARAGGRSAAIESTDPQMEFKAAEAAAAALDISPGTIKGNPTVCVGPVAQNTNNPCGGAQSFTGTLVHQAGQPNLPVWCVSIPGSTPCNPLTYPATDHWPVLTRNYGCPKNNQAGTFDRVAVRISIQHSLLIPGLFSVFFGNSNAPTLGSSSVFQLEPVPTSAC